MLLLSFVLLVAKDGWASFGGLPPLPALNQGASSLGFSSAPTDTAPEVGAGARPKNVNAGSTDVLGLQHQAGGTSGPCARLTAESTNVGRECWAQVWIEAGCLADSVPPYEQWHASQSLQILRVDAQQWASLPDPKHRRQCYGADAAGGIMGGEQDLQYGEAGMVEQGQQQGSGPLAAPTPPGKKQGSFVHFAASSDHFVSLIQSSRVVIVNFGSEMCGFCVLMAPVYELLAEKYAKKRYVLADPSKEIKGKTFAHQVLFLYVDVQAVPDVGDMFGVQGLPAFRTVIDSAVVPFLTTDGADTTGLENMVSQAFQLAGLAESSGDDQLNNMASLPLGSGSQAIDVPGLLPGTTGTSAGGVQLDFSAATDQDLVQSLKALRREIRTRGSKGADTLKLALYSSDMTDGGASSSTTSSAKTRNTTTTTGMDSNMDRVKIPTGGVEPAAGSTASSAFPLAASSVLGKPDLLGVNKDELQSLVIIGAGPAGLAAALYGARAGLSPVVIAPRMTHAGQLLGKGVDVENYPGTERGTGAALVTDMRMQAEAFGVQFVTGYADGIDFGDIKCSSTTSPKTSASKIFTLRLQKELLTGSPATDRTIEPQVAPQQQKNKVNHEAFAMQSRAIVLATGAQARWLGIPGEEELRGHGVSSCAACDGFLYRGKTCAVIGGGDSAVEEAIFLSKICKAPLHLVHRRDSLRAGRVLQERLARRVDAGKVQMHWNKLVTSFIADTNVDDALASGAKKLVSITLKDAASSTASMSVRDDNKTTLDINAAFVAIGHDPNTALLQGIARFKGSSGYLLTGSQAQGPTSSMPSSTEDVKREHFTTQTSIPGLFAAGDVADSVYRQAITSAASGAQAAMDADRWLSALTPCFSPGTSSSS
ncbi:unnamed protein product [Amoebophrya sp. A25]|nr:unnamed protein product [Amoebophrya sp. A25]|eukprot:GSA25T00011146001.1